MSRFPDGPIGQDPEPSPFVMAVLAIVTAWLVVTIGYLLGSLFPLP